MESEVKFEWDLKKAGINKSKHRVDFETAVHVFLDPDRYEECNYSPDENEYRYKTIGFVGSVLLVVIYVERESGEKTVRIISARKANEKERRWYSEIHP